MRSNDSETPVNPEPSTRDCYTSDGRAHLFPEAGSDDDLRRAHIRQMVQERRDEARRLHAAARRKLRGARPDRTRSEGLARRALERYARSLDWSEDSDMEDEAHRLLDRAGKWVRLTFGCHLAWDGTGYRQECPVSLAHNRIGLSVGGPARRKCSLCGQDVSECEHLPGFAYVVPGGTEELGWCRICLAKACVHTPEDVERVSMISIIYDMDLEEVSIVAKPAHPEARLTSISVSTEELGAALGEAFVPGAKVSCDRCVGACAGLEKHGDGFGTSVTSE